MTQTFDTMMEEAIWTARQLYSDGMVQGSAGNISFRLDDRIFISGSGTLFARLTREDFVEMDLDGQNKGAGTPSKEYPLHLALYQCQPQTKAVIHTHSFYTTLWSCMQKTDQEEIFPSYTPYLKMQFQSIGRVPYALPPFTVESFGHDSIKSTASA